MMNRREAYMMLDRMLGWTGSQDARVIIRGSENGLTRFARAEIHQNIVQEDLQVDIELRRGKKRTSISTNKLSEGDLRGAIREAGEQLKHAPEREMDLPLLAEPEEINSENRDEKLQDKLDISGRAELVSEGLDELPAGFTAAGSLACEKSFIALGNSRGIRRFARRDSGEFNTVVSSQAGKSSGYAELSSETAEDFDVIEVFSRAGGKAADGENPVDIDPDDYTVVLEPLAVAELLGYLAYTGFSGRSVQQGRSFLAGKLGEKIWGENISIFDDCQHPATITLPFDLEGAKRKFLTIIEEGVARELAYDLASARKEGLETTGHSTGSASLGGLPIHLVMEGGDSSREEMISTTEEGLLITRFHYTNIVNPRQAILTGLTRDGTFLIENGEIARPVRDLRFTESMLKAFNNVISLSSERFKAPGLGGVSYVPHLKIEDFHFSGKTEE